MNKKKTIHKKEIHKEIKKRLDAEMHELIVPEASEEDVERQKEMNKELDTTLDTQKQISDLQKEASDDDVARQEKMKDAVDATTDSIEKATDASEKSDVAEKIAHKVREKLQKESLDEGKKESTADIKQRIKDLVQKLKDQNDHLYPEGAKDLAIDMIKKMDIKEALESMGTADEDTMKYLLQDIGREELVNFEKQFVVMFDLLRDIRYDGSEQLSKGASEISQRIHNFITIFRQALKGNPVVKEDNTKSLTNNHSNPVNEAAKKRLVSLINNIALKEGISKKEATIKAIKALKEGISKEEATIKTIKGLQESK